MKKAKALAKGNNNSNKIQQLLLVIDDKYTLSELSQKSLEIFAKFHSDITKVMALHNALMRSVKVPEVFSSLEAKADQLIEAMNAYLDAEFSKVRKSHVKKSKKPSKKVTKTVRRKSKQRQRRK